MRLLTTDETGEFSLTEDLDEGRLPPYAILSHRWLADAEEPTFEDLARGTGKEKLGYKKLQFCGEQARQDGIAHFWVDTCCIEKTNKAELARAIKCMFRWYQSADVCYVYLWDVSSHPAEFGDAPRTRWREQEWRNSEWLTRAWTLQELLAPRALQFFTREAQKLGDKRSLEGPLHEITGIPKSALRGAPLSEFSVQDRLSWTTTRESSPEEDKAYSLLGIFDIDIAPLYGSGTGQAFTRLMEEIGRREKCIRDIFLSDPRKDKKRIEETKGGLLNDCYRWVLENPDFQQWRESQQSQLLWIKGDPGKGKTMLLCGIINELAKLESESHIHSYFFCQASDGRLNTATAVLRGLTYLLTVRKPSLTSYILEEYDVAGKALFEDTNAWVAVSDIFYNLLQDHKLNTTWLIIDALDECVVDLDKLLAFIVRTSTISGRVKWILSSRNWSSIQERLEKLEGKLALSLELNARSVSGAVSTFMKHKVQQLAERKAYNDKTRANISNYLSHNADNTFLWVALVCQYLENSPRWVSLAQLRRLPPGLDSLYERMLEQVCDSDHADVCKRILATIVVVHRPITSEELAVLVGALEDFPDDSTSIRDIVSHCGSFLTVREDTIHFVHLSARDFLLGKARSTVFPSGTGEVHYEIFSRSLQILSSTVKRDIYNLRARGRSIVDFEIPDPDPLARVRYSCLYWIDHLSASDFVSFGDSSKGIRNGAVMVDEFLRTKYLYWLEALSLSQVMFAGVLAMARLEALLQERIGMSALLELVRDARRFVMHFKQAIEGYPLQTYVSALLFSPSRSIIREHFQHEAPDEVVINPLIADEWSACIQTLEGHSGPVTSVVFSHNSNLLASASYDSMVKIWEASSGRCLQTLKGHRAYIDSVVFSHDSSRLASASGDKTINIWEASSGRCLQTLEGHRRYVSSVVFSHDSSHLASASYDSTIKIWEASSGRCLQTLEGHRRYVSSVVFSHDSSHLASASEDRTVKIWEASSGRCLQTLKCHSGPLTSVVFSHDSSCLASASGYGMVKIWEASSGRCMQTLKGHSDLVTSVVFSHDSSHLASTSKDNTVKIWDASNAMCLQTLRIGKMLSKISFDTTGSHLCTEIGSLVIDDLRHLSTTEILPEPQEPQYRGAGMSPDGMWITYDSVKVIWLPSEYRALCSVATTNTIGVGVGSGRVWLCSFVAQNSRKSLSSL